MVFDRIVEALANFVTLVRHQPPADPLLFLPAVVLFLTWPMFQVLFADQAAAFMSAFVLAMALRLALRFEVLVLKLERSTSPRGVAAAILLIVPAVLALLIWQGDPLWCQRFLSVYFLAQGGLYALDVIDGANRLVRQNFPGLVLPRAEAAMSQTMVIYFLGMALLNEGLIRHAGPSLWLLYFGLLPLLSRRVLLALHGTVRVGYQGRV